MISRKRVPSIAVIAFAVGALAACGNDGPTTPSSVPAIAAAPAPAPEPEAPSMVAGVVSEVIDGIPVGIEGVLVEDGVRHVSVMTDADGSYQIADVETYSGNAYLTFWKDGYETETRMFALEGSETRVDVELSRE